MPAPITIAKDAFGAHEIPLKAGVEQIVNFELSVREIELENVSGTGRVYFTTDGTEASVKGSNCRALPAAIHAVEVTRENYSGGKVSTVRLIAAADTVVSVTRV